MESTHFYALLPLLILFVVSLLFYRVGFVHLVTVGYAMALGWFAVQNTWEIMFFPVICGVVLICLILFFISMAKGELIG